uniref:Coiled-coil domain-containing protein 149 n=1 Tax=Clastoptera arizonana TaxID=38151 RepID=A0A1B6EDA0_9HEMI
MDNTYLHERLEQILAEKELALQALSKYKSMLDNKRSKGTAKLGNSAGMVVSQKQVQELLGKSFPTNNPNAEAALSDLKSLCHALLEALQDKSLAFTHQKRGNKILASRITELEKRLETTEGVCMPAFSSQLLLQGYSSAHVDKDLERIDLETEGNSLPSTESEETILQDGHQNGFENDLSDDLPSDLQKLVQQALQDIKDESLKPS